MSWTKTAHEAKRIAVNTTCAVGAEVTPNTSLGLTGVSSSNLFRTRLGVGDDVTIPCFNAKPVEEHVDLSALPRRYNLGIAD